MEKHRSVAPLVDDNSPVISGAAHPLLDQELPDLGIDVAFFCAGDGFAQVFITDLVLTRLASSVLCYIGFYVGPSAHPLRFFVF
nr:hypothetical protein [Microvirga arsenatis]